MTQQTGSTSIGRRSLVVCLVIVCVLAAIAVPAIYQARMEARRTTSKNNLKQLMLAIHNHDDVWRCLPPGSRAAEDGTVLHGWYQYLLPFIASSPIYKRIDRELPWDHPLNRYNFKGDYHGHNILGVAPWFTSEGYGTLHYLANPNAMHRESEVVFDDMTGGTSNFWLLGEGRPQFAPWGYQFNWREIEYPLGQDDGFGGPWGGTNFAMADGSVRLVSDDVSQEVVQLARDQPPLAPAAARARPNKTFAAGHAPALSSFFADPSDETSPMFAIFYSQDDVAQIAFREYRSKDVAAERGTHIGDIEKLVAGYPTLRELFVRVGLTDETLPVFAGLKELEVLRVGGVNLSEDGFAKLARLESLKVLQAWVTIDTREALRSALPDCELYLTLVEKEGTP